MKKLEATVSVPMTRREVALGYHIKRGEPIATLRREH